MNKKILLVEPAYKTKFPPLGLMKIATYHKYYKHDDVTFVKGKDLKIQYQYWDRVYIGTLFTWTWKETVDTIKFYHDTIFNYGGRCFVGGIMASLLPDELFNATGIQPVEGLLDDPRKIDQDDDIIIDKLPPDYEILKQVEKADFKYSNTDSYLGYTTRGCIRKCGFCAVKTFEPIFIPYVDINKTIKGIIKNSGEKQNLVLMDNNVLASSKFDKIINDIKSLGFVKGASFKGSQGKNRRRIVDFNQGLDARILTEEKMKRLSEIPLDPMRIAFDSLEMKDIYLKAVRLANKYGQTNMSNYILYNFKDSPEEFYERLKINIDLNEEFKNTSTKTIIYSFPMRFIPLKATERNVDTGNKLWNKRYLRSIKVILNVMKGPVMPGKEFFLQAFGRSNEEFKAIILMPEEFIRNRLVKNWKTIPDYDLRLMPYVKDWMQGYFNLSEKDKLNLINILGVDDVDYIHKRYTKANKKIKKMLDLHLTEKETVEQYINSKQE